MPYLIAGAVLGSVFFGMLFWHQLIFFQKENLNKRIEKVVGEIKKFDARQKELNKSLYQRVIKPMLNKLSLRFVKMLPKEKEAVLEKAILLAGNPGGLGAQEFIIIQYLSAAIGALIFAFYGKILNMELIVLLVFAGLGTMLGKYLPTFYLKNKFKKRQADIIKNLPDVLDLLTVSVEAGLGFDGAILKVVEKSNHVLAEEFNKMLYEIQMGRPRREALRDLVDRTYVDDLSTFVGAIIQADQLGISISNVLKLQSQQMRQKRRQKAEEAAMKAPIKMLIPMVVFIFPTIFIVLLGPAVIQLMKVFAER